MGIDREFRLLLEYAHLPESPVNTGQVTVKGDAYEAIPHDSRVPVQEIYARLVRVRDQQVLPSMGIGTDVHLPELLVLLAEAAVHQENFDVANKCVKWFLSDFSLPNQFYCRIQFVRALCASQEAQSDYGATKLRKVLNAIHFVLVPIPISMDPRHRPQYDFLVYNASVIYWRIARQLMKTSTFQFLSPSLIAIVDALKSVKERDTMWIARLQLALVHAQIDAKQFASAAKSINDVVDVQLSSLLKDPTTTADATALKQLYEEALRIQIHVGSFADAECQKIIPNVKKTLPATSSRAMLLVKLQTIKSGEPGNAQDVALLQLFQETVGMPSFSTETTTEEELLDSVRTVEANSASAIDAEIIVEIGILAAFSSADRLALRCDFVLDTKGKSMGPKCRVLHQVLKAILLVLAPPPTVKQGKLTLEQRTGRLIARRVEGIKALERALLAGKRHQDPNLIESICVYAWNLSLPLLQPNLRGQLSRMLSVVSSSLEELHSLLLNLRARILLEVAKMEVCSDFMAKAQANVNNALGLDYGVILSENSTTTLNELTANESKWTSRALDVHLFPLKKRLDLKLSLEDPSAKEDMLAAAVEQMKDAKDVAQRKRQLQRALVIIADILKDSDGGIIGPCTANDSSINILLHMNAVSAFAWHEFQDPQAARTVTQETLRLFFSADPMKSQSGDESALSDKRIRILEVDLRLRLVEILANDMMDRANRYMLLVNETKKREDVKNHHVGLQRKPSQLKSIDDEADIAAIVSLHKDAHILGVQIGYKVTDSVQSVGDVDDGEVIDTKVNLVDERRATIESELASIKKEIIRELTAALGVATHIGWAFVIENTTVFLWNYHFHLFRMIVDINSGGVETTSSPGSPLQPPSTAIGVDSIIPECLEAFEASLTALEHLSPKETNIDLLAAVSFGLALVYEKLSRFDRVLAIAESFLKRKPAHTTDPIGNNAGVSLLHLKRFTEVKIRAQLKNAKDIQPVEILPHLKVMSFLEAMESTLQQTDAKGFASLPPSQQAQATEKALGFYQKALQLWQSVAPDALASMESEVLTLEEQQQQLEIYAESWVRLGCGAFRLHNAKYATVCGENALLLLSKRSFKGKEHNAVIGENTWKWFAIAELLIARVILSLLGKETAAWPLIERALGHLARACQHAVRIGAVSLAQRASETAWNLILVAFRAIDAEKAAGEPEGGGAGYQECWRRLLPSLLDIVSSLQRSSVGNAGMSCLLGELTLLVLEVCEKSNQWKSVLELADMVIHHAGGSLDGIVIPPDLTKEISIFRAIAAATLGKTTISGCGGGKEKAPDTLVQANIHKTLAFSSRKNPMAQLKALADAFKELENMPRERALVVMDIAEWYHANQFPTQEVIAYLDGAFNILMNEENSTTNSHQTAPGCPGSSNRSNKDTACAPELEYSILWTAEKLIRLFAMRATIATNMAHRLKHLQNALLHVHMAWKCIVDLTNECDLRNRYESVTSESGEIEFEEWKKDQKSKHLMPDPSTPDRWAAFYVNYATSATTRFHTPWIAALESVASERGESDLASRELRITQPVLTANTLETILAFLAERNAFEQMLPVICLYQVVYHAYSPHKCRSVEIWIELMLYRVLERLNLSVFCVPLQSALEMLQSGGDIILKELQEQSDEESEATANEETVITADLVRKRTVLQFSRFNVDTKIFQTIDALLMLGYGRQAKVLLTILQSMTQRKKEGDLMSLRCEEIRGRVLSIEGEETRALACFTRTLASPSAIALPRFVRVVLLRSHLEPDKKKAQQDLFDAERTVASSVITANTCPLLPPTQATTKYLSSLLGNFDTTQPPPDSGLGTQFELDGVVGLAEIKYARAELLLSRASSSILLSSEMPSNRFTPAINDNDFTIEHAMRVFRESMELLTIVDAKMKQAEWSVAFAKELICHHHRYRRPTPCHVVDDDALLEARACLEHAMVHLESIRSHDFDHLKMSVEAETAPSSGSILIPLDIALADVKILLARLEVELEGSSGVITEQQMTWYSYTRDAGRNVVERWLEQTAQRVQIERNGNVSRAVVLGSTASRLLCLGPEVWKPRTLAQVVVLQARRIAIYHHIDPVIKASVHQALWTKFTSSTAQHATWICARNGGKIDDSQDEDLSEVDSTGDSTNENMEYANLSKIGVDLEMHLALVMEKRYLEVASICAYELIQVYGCNRARECVRSLLLYQSLTVREQHMAPLMGSCLETTNTTKLHMKRIENVSSQHTIPQLNSLPVQLSQLFLEQQSDVYKRMSVEAPVETILSALPARLCVLTLQFSPDNCFLYAAMTGPADKRYVMCRMECTKEKLQMLTELKTRVTEWRRKSVQVVLNTEEPETMQDLSEFVAQADGTAGALDTTREDLEREFNIIVGRTTELLSPLFQHSAFHSVLHSELQTEGNGLLLLPDRILDILPLEALEAFAGFEFISRDFSMHMFHHRLMAVKAEPFRRGGMCFITDPHQEDRGVTGQTITSIVHSHTEGPEATLPLWKYAIGHQQVPTSSDWQHALVKGHAGGLCYVGPNRVLGSAVPLKALAGMNLARSCYALLLFDRAENQESTRRQSKHDSEKLAWELAMEDDSYSCALLASLCGVNVVMLNQWTTSFNSNRRQANSMLTSLGRGVSIGKALRTFPETVVPLSLALQSRQGSVTAASMDSATTASPSRSSSSAYRLKNCFRYNSVLFGLGHLTFKAND